MHEGDVNVGDLILYENMDSKLIYGIVAEAASWRKEFNGPAVRVCWFDDASMTYESVEAILSDEDLDRYIGVVSGNR